MESSDSKRAEPNAPDLEWPGAQNSYHAPRVQESAANLTVPAPGQVPGGDSEAGWVTRRAEEDPKLLLHMGI